MGLAVMVISQPPGNNPSRIIIVFPNAVSIALNASRDTLCSIHMQLQHQGNSEQLHIFFTRTDPRRDHHRLFFYSFCRSEGNLPFILAVKILLQIFLYEDLHVILHIHLSVVFPSRMPAGPHFVTQPILLSENIPSHLT